MAAYMRNISTRANLLRRQYYPLSSGYIVHDDDREQNKKSVDKVPSSLEGMASNNLLQQRAFGSGFINVSSRRCLDFLVSASIGASFFRYMSTTMGEGSEKTELISDVADVLAESTDEAVAQAAPALNEVAVAAADSFFPVAVLQHLIDSVRCFTGFNWWTSIVLTTILVRGATIPFLINYFKAISKLIVLKPRLDEITEQMQEKGMNLAAAVEAQKQVNLLLARYGINAFTLLNGAFIQSLVFISFEQAISNMVKKVPSFKTDGAYWFVDLTTPDGTCIFPLLTVSAALIAFECNIGKVMEPRKDVPIIFVVVPVSLLFMFHPKAIFFYWITSDLFWLTRGLVLKLPVVKKALGIPEILVENGKNKKK